MAKGIICATSTVQFRDGRPWRVRFFGGGEGLEVLVGSIFRELGKILGKLDFFFGRGAGKTSIISIFDGCRRRGRGVVT